MANCSDTVTPWIQRVTMVGTPVATPITFPTVPIAKTQLSNGTIILVAGVSQVVSVSNVNRKFLQLTNVTGSACYVNFGAVATTGSQIIPNNSVYTLDINTLGQMNLSSVNVLSVAGAATGFNLYEEQ